MKITDLLKKQSVRIDASANTKEEAIDILVSLMNNAGNIKDLNAYKEAVLAREALSTTGIGEGIAIPHAQSDAISTPGLSSMVVKDGVDYESLDGAPAKLFFMIAVPNDGGTAHLQILQRLSQMLMDGAFRQSLVDASSPEEFMRIIDDKETEKKESEEKKEAASNMHYDVLAVTACPTGIAHTYMAAEALENKAAELGIKIKVETDGSGGAKNILTEEDIKNAKCIIVAADKNIEMSRFHGKPVIQTKVANGIHKTTELLTKATSGEVGIYESSEDAPRENLDGGGSAHEIYKHLMNGVSHMLPFVIGGGILIALSFLFDDASIDPSKFGSNTPFAALLKQVGDTAFGFMLPILAGYIAMSIADRPALAVGFVGGALANAGGSGFLGALLAGFVAGYLMKYLRKACDHLPKALEGLKPTLIYPFLGILGIGAIIILIVNPPVSELNNMITNFLNSMGGTSKILLGIILGGMMAVDMGGPINKAAYVFGTASIATGNYDVMAAVMIGGMVPPLAIAISSSVFKSKFTQKERQSGLTNFIMGLSFITEGAIPFAASDPLHVLPACVIGSATAGALSMAFDCTLMAPHGGLFVIGVISNPLGYIIALVIGAIIGAVVLGVIKKPVTS